MAKERSRKKTDSPDDEPTGGKEKKAAVTRMDWRQTGTCAESQADGVPCDEIGHDCEDCDRSELDTERKSRQRLPT